MNKTRSISLSNVTKIGILAALAFILMFFQVPIPIAPPFMRVDLADVPALIGGFAMGPWAGVAIQLVKNILNLTKTQTVGVGELSNFIVGSTFVFVASTIYKNRKTKKTAIFALACGVIAMTAIATLSNAFVVFPAYAKAMGFPLEAFAGQVPGNPLVKSYVSLMLLSIVPFNLVKGTVAALITELIYKRVSPILKAR